MLRSTIARRTSVVPAAVAGEPKQFPNIIVGGGAAGSLIAGRLSADNLRVAVLEEGPDVLSAWKWHREAPAAPLLHRAAGRYIGKRDGTVGAQPVKLEVPRVLGGAGVVLGSKAWVRGHEFDWRDGVNFPLPFEEAGLILQYKRLESVEKAEKHRGNSGRFLVTKAKGVTQIYKEVLNGYQKAQTGLINSFNGARGFIGSGAGRAEALVDFANGGTLSSVNQFLGLSRQMKRPVTTVTDFKVSHLVFDKEGRATTVVGNGKSGENAAAAAAATYTSNGGPIVLAAGALATPAILLNSENLPAATATALANAGLWAVPSRTLRYATSNNFTLAAAAHPLIQVAVAADWWWNKAGWMASSYDDMVCYVESSVSRKRRGVSLDQYAAYPDIKITLQPFGTTPDGHLLDQHSVQFQLQLIRPSARGKVAADGSVSIPESADDSAALDEGVALIKKIAEHVTPGTIAPGGPVDTWESWVGPYGGTVPLGAAVDPETFRLVGTSNVFVADASLIPNPLVAEPLALTYALSDLCADRVSRKAPSII